MHFELSYDTSVEAGIPFVENRLYIVTTLVPPGYEPYFREHAQFISAHTSTKIEGNELSQEEALKVVAEGLPARLSPAQIELTNLNEGYELLSDLSGDASIRLDEGLIRAFNSLILRGLPGSASENRGRYRRTAALVVDSVTHEIRYRPPAPERVPDLMEGFTTFLDNKVSEGCSGPILAALAHFGLISVHPFEDGNGRTARLIADFVLQQTKWAANGMLSISQVMLDNRDQYYSILQETQGLDFIEEIDVTPFIHYHTRTIGLAAARLEDRVVSFRQRLDRFRDGVGQVLNPRQAMGISFVMDMEIPLSSARYAKMTGCSQSAAIADLNHLVEIDMVSRVGSGKLTRYVLSPKVKAGIAE